MKFFFSLCFLFILIGCSNNPDDTSKNIEANSNSLSETQKEAILDGELIEKHPNGNIKTKGILKNGKRDGIWTSYFSSGVIQSENKYVNGELNGKTTAYYPNGRPQYFGMYIKGVKEGRWYFYLEDGTLDKEIVFKNGQKAE